MMPRPQKGRGPAAESLHKLPALLPDRLRPARRRRSSAPSPVVKLPPSAAQLSVLMAGLRGSNIDSSDFADNGVVMQLISVSDSDGESLPLTYDPQAISEYWGRRPVSVLTRLAQLGGARPLRALTLRP